MTLCHPGISDTSRSPRPGEVHGDDYYFVPRPEMQEDIRAGRYIEHGEFKVGLNGAPARRPLRETRAI